ncbi:MAG: biopolymer transporter ExbD, partial [bacterium]
GELQIVYRSLPLRAKPGDFPAKITVDVSNLDIGDSVKVKESNIATLFVQADNSVTLDNKPIVINRIKAAIEDRIFSNPKLVVLLKVHPDANYGYMVACLDELKLANATKVSLKTSDK